MRFCELTGQKNTVKKLISTVNDNRISHAQLFFGASGTGMEDNMHFLLLLSHRRCKKGLLLSGLQGCAGIEGQSGLLKASGKVKGDMKPGVLRRKGAEDMGRAWEEGLKILLKDSFGIR